MKMLVVDGLATYRMGLCSILSKKGWETIEGKNGKEALKILASSEPDIVIMELVLPDMDGIEVIRIMRQQCPEVKIITITSHADEEHVRGALEAGVCAYLSKDISKRGLFIAIEAVIDGKKFLDPHVTEIVIRGYLCKISEERPERELITQGLQRQKRKERATKIEKDALQETLSRTADLWSSVGHSRLSRERDKIKSDFKILLVEDHMGFRQVVKALLFKLFPEIIVAEASSADDIQVGNNYDLIFLDINLPGTNGLNLIPQLKELFPVAKVVMLTSYDLPEYRNEAFRKGATAYLVKGLVSEDEIGDLCEDMPERTLVNNLASAT